MLLAAIPDLMPWAAAGLCGEGSECFGCDDEYSRDHDSGPAFCLWLPQKLFFQHRQRLAELFSSLPATFMGLRSRFASGCGKPGGSGSAQGRVGPLAIEAFYAFFTGLEHPPQSLKDWLKIPEFQLAAASNGRVFEDNLGQFSAWRQSLLAFYPEDLRLKKIVARCLGMAQSGQYNLPRCLARGDAPASMLALARFCEAALSLVFLLNKRYMPFYKWSPRLVRSLPLLGADLGSLLDRLALTPLASAEASQTVQEVENFCALCAEYFCQSGLTASRDSWLWEQGLEISHLIENSELKKLSLLDG